MLCGGVNLQPVTLNISAFWEVSFMVVVLIFSGKSEAQYVGCAVLKRGIVSTASGCEYLTPLRVQFGYVKHRIKSDYRVLL